MEQTHAQSERERSAKLFALQEAHAERERELTAQLIGIQQRANDAVGETARVQAQVESERSAKAQAQFEAREILQPRIETLVRQVEEARAQEARLLSEVALQSEQAARIAREVAKMHQSYSWRLTAPFRRLRSGFEAHGFFRAGSPPRANEIAKDAARSCSQVNLSAMPETPERLSDSHHDLACAAASIDSLDSNIRQEHAMTSIDHVGQLLDLHEGAFIDAAYMTLLARAPDPVGRRYYFERLRSGHSKATVLVQIFESAEGRAYDTNLPGLSELVSTEKKANHWLWGRLTRSRRIEQNLHRIDSKLCDLVSQQKRMECLLSKLAREINSQVNTLGISSPKPSDALHAITPAKSGLEGGFDALATTSVNRWPNLKSNTKTPLEEISQVLVRDFMK